MERTSSPDERNSPGRGGAASEDKDRLVMMAPWRKVRLVLDASNEFSKNLLSRRRKGKGIPYDRYVTDLGGTYASQDASTFAREAVNPSFNLPDSGRKFRRVGRAVLATLWFKGEGEVREICCDERSAPGFEVGLDYLQCVMSRRQLRLISRRGGATKIAEQLKTSIFQGLDGSRDALHERKDAFGSNEIPPKRCKCCRLFIGSAEKCLSKAFRKPSNLILLACAILLLIAEMCADSPQDGWHDSFTIAVGLCLDVVLETIGTFWESLRSESACERKRNREVDVIRSGQRLTISVFDVLVGDIVPVFSGDQIPADGILISEELLTVDEFCATGETARVSKGAENPFLLSQSRVVDGSGVILILAVGVNTEWGKNMSNPPVDEECKVFVDRIKVAVTVVEYLGVPVVVVVIVIVVVRYFVENSDSDASAQHKPKNFVKNVVISSTLGCVAVVVNTPEFLSFTASLTWTISMRKAKAGKLEFLNFEACEKVGFLTNICCNKTGTLTLSDMTVEKSVVAGRYVDVGELRALTDRRKELRALLKRETTASHTISPAETAKQSIDVPDAGRESFGAALPNASQTEAGVQNLAACGTIGSTSTVCGDKTGSHDQSWMNLVKDVVADKLVEAEEGEALPRDVYGTLLVGLCQNSTGSVSVSDDGGGKKVSGSPTEAAALSWGLEIGLDYEGIKGKTQVVHMEAFDPAKLRAGVIVERLGLTMEPYEAHWKGAAEVILEKCADWVDESGTIRSFTPKKFDELKKLIEGMAAKGLRCIAYAYTPLARTEFPATDEERRTWKIPCNNLAILCVIGIKDSCREGVREAVKKCKAAGIKVRVVTGDSLLSAQYVAEKCGILTEGENRVMEGHEFRELHKEGMDTTLKTLEVLARASPSDKERLVKELKDRGDVVAFWGAKKSDAPAIHGAHVGISMNTENTKVDSDIVVLADGFPSIIKVVEWGRSVLPNIQKFLQFQLTAKIALTVINAASAIRSSALSLTILQSVWVNFSMTILGGLALVTGTPTDDLMDKAPARQKERPVTIVMCRNVLIQTIYQIAVLMAIDKQGSRLFRCQHVTGSRAQKNTIVFNSFVVCQLFNMVNARRTEGKNIFKGLSNNRLFVIIMVLQIAFQFLIVQFLETKLTWKEWLGCVAVGLFSWPLAYGTHCFDPCLKPLWVKVRQRWEGDIHAPNPGSNNSRSSRGGVAHDIMDLPQEGDPPVTGETMESRLLSSEMSPSLHGDAATIEV